MFVAIQPEDIPEPSKRSVDRMGGSENDRTRNDVRGIRCGLQSSTHRRSQRCGRCLRKIVTTKHLRPEGGKRSNDACNA
jgi:hypothetical protein